MKDSFSYSDLHLEEKRSVGKVSTHPPTHPSLKNTYEIGEKLKNTTIKLLCSDIAFDSRKAMFWVSPSICSGYKFTRARNKTQLV